jgi:hypothetical protein
MDIWKSFRHRCVTHLYHYFITRLPRPPSPSHHLKGVVLWNIFIHFIYFINSYLFALCKNSAVLFITVQIIFQYKCATQHCLIVILSPVHKVLCFGTILYIIQTQGLGYSVLRFLTGLAIAAFIACELTVINAIETASKPANANIHQRISVL